jgi:hypothetical protein
MRKQFIDEIDARTESAVFDLCPWAAEVIRVAGGWFAFESVVDANIWRNQR